MVKAVNKIISSFCFAACGKKITKVRVARAAQLFFPVQLQANGIMEFVASHPKYCTKLFAMLSARFFRVVYR